AAGVLGPHGGPARQPQAAGVARPRAGLLHQRADHAAHALADAGGRAAGLRADGARQGTGRARGRLPPRAAQRAAARGDLRRLAGLAGQQPLGAAGAVVVAAMIVAAIWAPQLAPYGAKDAAFAPYAPPGPGHPMGTDQLGRDVLSRVVWGARLSLYVGLVSVVLGVTLGSLWGVVSAYVGGMTDTLSQRVVDSLMAL